MDPPLKTTLVTMKLLAPRMFWSMLIISLVIERPWNKFQNADEESLGQLRDVLTLGVIGGTLAIAMVLCEFYLILHSSALILMIGGVVKEMTTIVIGYV
jgi:solute carrier family 35 protein C2